MRGVDVKLPEYTAVDADEFEIADLRLREEAVSYTHLTLPTTERV